MTTQKLQRYLSITNYHYEIKYTVFPGPQDALFSQKM